MSGESKNYECAFPQPRDDQGRTPDEFGVGGMTLRDYFAASALAAFRQIGGLKNHDIAKRVYAISDSMMEARKS